VQFVVRHSASRSAQVDAFEDERELTRLQLEGTSASIGAVKDLELPMFQALGKNAVSRAIPPEHFDPVAPAIEEEEEMSGLWILLYDVDNERRERVEGLPHVGRTACDEESYRRR